MNAALLLVTSAFLAGADAAPPAKPAAPPAATPAPAAAAAPAVALGGCGSCCSNDCGCGCESKPSFFERLKARFHKSSCCEDSCSSRSTCAAPAPVATSCGSACDCDPCAKSHGGKLRGFFKHKSSDCEWGCEPSCSSCGSAAPAHAAPPAKMAPAGEPIKAPKEEKKSEAPPKELPKGTTAAPVIDFAPPATTKIEGAKSPF